MKIKSQLINLVPLLAIPAAIFLPQTGGLFSPFTTWLLGGLLFVAFLGLDTKKLLHELKDPMDQFFMTMVILVVTPLVVMPIMGHFFPAFLLGALLFMLMPSAVSAPAVTRIYGGNVALTTANTVFSNLLSPFSIPILIAFFAGKQVEVSLLTILWQLLILMVVPFLLSLLVQHFAGDLVEKTKKSYNSISLLILFLLFFGALSPFSRELVANFLNQSLWLAVIIAYVILFFFAKLMVVYVKAKRDKISIQANLMFTNVGLAIVLAQNFFGSAEVIFIIYCQIFWLLMLSLFRYLK